MADIWALLSTDGIRTLGEWGWGTSVPKSPWRTCPGSQSGDPANDRPAPVAGFFGVN